MDYLERHFLLTVIPSILSAMQTFTFTIRFRFDSTEYHEISFDLALNDDEIAFLKGYLKENGDMPFWAFDYENEPLFNRFMEAHIAAILAYVNREIVTPGEEPFTEETVDGECLFPEFYWPNTFLS